MCGRYARFSPAEIYARLFDADGDPGVTPSFNVAPSQQVLAARGTPDGRRELVALRWGLLPAWAKDLSFGYRTINARAESVAVKPAFRAAFRHRRCLVAADGFYEWQRVGGGKRPYFIRVRGGGPLAFAGLWERWTDGRVLVESCTIVVTVASGALAAIHDRMPVILEPSDYDAWLDPGITEPGRIQDLLSPRPTVALEAFPVAATVNNPRHDGPDLIRPLLASPTAEKG